MDILSKFEQHIEDTKDLDEAVDSIYTKYVSNYLKTAKEFRAKFNSDTISDNELESILTSLPLELIDVSENISKLKLKREALKLSIKEKWFNKYNSFSVEDKLSDTRKREQADLYVIEDKVLVELISTVIVRAEADVSMYRELIMGAKKVYDNRRKTDGVVPVSPVTQPDLPEYDRYSTGGKYYVK